MRPRAAGVAVVLLLHCLCACRSGAVDPTSTPPTAAVAVASRAAPPLPDDDAGRIVARAIAAAGGWEAWAKHRDASFVSTFTVFDPLGHAVSETIFQHRMPLHQGLKIRLESIGLIDELIFAFDGKDEWMLRDGKPVDDVTRMEFIRFHAISNAYWFSMPFVLAEIPGELSYLGSETSGDDRYEKVRVGYSDDVPVPFDWMILYFDAETAKLERVHVHALADFLQHSLWVGVWRDERSSGGISIGRRRAFFPADAAGEIVGAMAAEQLVEHTEFDGGLAPELFSRPENARLTAELES